MANSNLWNSESLGKFKGKLTHVYKIVDWEVEKCVVNLSKLILDAIIHIFIYFIIWPRHSVLCSYETLFNVEIYVSYKKKFRRTRLPMFHNFELLMSSLDQQPGPPCPPISSNGLPTFLLSSVPNTLGVWLDSTNAILINKWVVIFNFGNLEVFKNMDKRSVFSWEFALN